MCVYSLGSYLRNSECMRLVTNYLWQTRMCAYCCGAIKIPKRRVENINKEYLETLTWTEMTVLS